MTMPACCRHLLIILGLTMSLTSCAGKPEEPAAAGEATSYSGEASAAAEAPVADGTEPAQSAPLRRYIALSQQISLRVPGNNLQSTWETLQQQALQMNGEVVTASYDNSNAQAGASLKVRIPPAKLDGYISLLKKSGNITSQTIGSEDKTGEVIDIDARMKNLAEARDQLRKMLAERSGKLADVLEVQKALIETQTELDSLSGQRKALEAITSRVTLDIELHGVAGMNNTDQPSAGDSVLDNWRTIGYVVWNMLLAIVGGLPVILPLVLVGWWFWRREKRRTAERLIIAQAQIASAEAAEKAATAKDDSKDN